MGVIRYDVEWLDQREEGIITRSTTKGVWSVGIKETTSFDCYTLSAYLSILDKNKGGEDQAKKTVDGTDVPQPWH